METPKDLTELDGSTLYKDWNQLVTNNQEVPSSSSLDNLMGNLESDQKGQDYWVDLFQKENFAGMDLMSANYQPYTIKENDVHIQFKGLIQSFLKDLVNNHINDLRSADLSEESIFYLSKGILPANWTIHLKYPLLYGGKLELDNLVLIPEHPFHELIHSYINQQVLSFAGVGHPKTLYLPIPLGKIYISGGDITGSGGKKKSDRSVEAGLTTANLQKIAIKTGGR